MDLSSLLTGGAMGVLVGVVVGNLIRAGKYFRALALFGIGTGSAGAVGGLSVLRELIGAQGLTAGPLLASYATATVVSAATTWVIAGVLARRRAPPREARMTREEWEQLTPLQRVVGSKRLREGKESFQIAAELGISVDTVNEEFLAAMRLLKGDPSSSKGK
ncbi:MAG: hypothetical protein HY744_21850 [Deltaproteobacteria bacterium]|nr:hypothetical protein [Deltaproteobacteria bacterium]